MHRRSFYILRILRNNCPLHRHSQSIRRTASRSRCLNSLYICRYTRDKAQNTPSTPPSNLRIWLLHSLYTDRNRSNSFLRRQRNQSKLRILRILRHPHNSRTSLRNPHRQAYIRSNRCRIYRPHQHSRSKADTRNKSNSLLQHSQYKSYK